VTIRNEETGASQQRLRDALAPITSTTFPPANSAPVGRRATAFPAVLLLSNFYLGVGRTNEIHPLSRWGSVGETVESRRGAHRPNVNQP